MRRFFLLVLLQVPSFWCVAQTPENKPRLSGQVLNQLDHSPLPGVTVQVLNSPLGTITDSEGKYLLSLPAPGTYQLRFSAVGFASEVQEMTARDVPIVYSPALRPALIQLHDQVVVTAQRYDTRAFDRPEAVTVVSTRDLAQDALRSTPEVLSGQSGVFVQKTNHGGGSPFIRGLTGQQTLLLVDGIRLNNATFRSGPNQYLNTIDPFLLDRVEVVRGGGSVQYGSDALGGTIHVLTRSPGFTGSRQVHGSVLGQWASGTMEKSGRVALGVSGPKAAVLGGLSYRNFGDLIGGAGIGRQTPTGYDQFSFDAKSLVKVNSGLQLTVAVQHLRQEQVPVYHKVQLENYAVNQFNPQVRSFAYARLEGVGRSKWLSSWQLTPLVARTVEGRQSRKKDAIRTLHERDVVGTYGFLASFLSQPARGWTIKTGTEWYHDRVDSQKQEVEPLTSSAKPPPVQRGLYPDNARMRNFALYTLHSFELKKWILTAGGRYNAFFITIPDQDLGSTTLTPSALVGNAGVAYAILPWLKAVGNLSTSFRAPNIDDLGTLGIVDFRFEVPNPTLRPERGFTKEIGLKIKRDVFSAAVAAYHTQLTDLIGRVKTDAVRQGYPVYLKENVATAYIRGLETEAECQVSPSWLLTGFVNYTYGQNVSKNEPYRRIPPLNGKVALRYQPTSRTWARMELYSAARQSRLAGGDRDDNRIPAGGTPGWWVVNAGAGHRLGPVKISAELQNLFNEAYRTHGSGVAGVGRSVWVRVQFDW